MEIFREHAALSALDNTGPETGRAFNLSALADISEQEYQQLTPVQWPVTAEAPGAGRVCLAMGASTHRTDARG